MVRTINLVYNFTTLQVSGDAIGGAGVQIYVPQVPANQYTPEIWFTIKSQG
ncbi:MAG: hypothetical protein WCF06_08085 [Nitrososphaeraceae archaeon]